MYRIGFGLTASYCTIKAILEQIKILVKDGYDVIPIVTDTLVEFDTRFQTAESIIKDLEEITSNKVITDIVEAEEFGPKIPLDLMVISPMSGNSLSKFCHAHNDNAVLMAAKATLRNGNPCVIGIATNDGLGLSGENVMKLLATKNIFFIPFGQDNYHKKPNSLVAHFELLPKTIEKALLKEQIQPVLRDYD